MTAKLTVPLAPISVIVTTQQSLCSLVCRLESLSSKKNSETVFYDFKNLGLVKKKSPLNDGNFVQCYMKL